MNTIFFSVFTTNMASKTSFIFCKKWACFTKIKFWVFVVYIINMRGKIKFIFGSKQTFYTSISDVFCRGHDRVFFTWRFVSDRYSRLKKVFLLVFVEKC